MKSLIALTRGVLNELGTRCGTSTERDWKTVSSRYEHEGFSFFTITLPTFGKGLEKALDLGYAAHDQFPGFAWAGGLPRFLGGFLELVFDRKTGRLLDDPSLEAIYSVRQFSLLHKKIELDCSSERVKAAFDGYVECEQEVRRNDAVLSPSLESDFLRMSAMLWASLFSSVENHLYWDGILPKHGPGSTADRILGNKKYDQVEWTRRLERVFPAWEHLVPNFHFVEKLESVNFLEPGAERPVRVISVPKTQKTPRIIALEPTCMQYVQQGVLEVLMQEERANDNAQSFVLSDSQVPNRELARRGSENGDYATIDLSEASDRVSYQHVRLLLARHPHFLESVDACRSRKADVPGHGVIRLAKFASMGSALCFPFEALVFCTIAFLGIEQTLNRRLTPSDIASYRGHVRVYGDDIIVPTDCAQRVKDSLESFGMRVNTDKSFWTGKFRESCGGDYYDGHDVSVVKCTSRLPNSRNDASQIVSTVALRNAFYMRGGFPQTVHMLDRLISRIIPFPEIESEECSLLGRVTFGPLRADRMCPDLQIPLVKGMKIRVRLPDSNLEDSGALMKFFLRRGDKPFRDENHLKRSGRPEHVYIKAGMAPPF